MKRFLIFNLFLIFLVPVVFLVVSLLTLSDYGINWDSSIHFIRGQSYLHFILTGKRDFLDYPAYPASRGAPDTVDYNAIPPIRNEFTENVEDASVRRSYYQSDYYTFDYFMTRHVHTHPEVNDLLLALNNYIFFQKLGLVGDIEAYHLFIVLATFALAAGLALWVYRNWGIFASIIASSSLVLYPLVFAESHFNIKDPILMSFFGLAILSFWHGFSKGRFIYIILSAVLAGFALGTKFNTLFLPFILGPWAVFVLIKRFKNCQVKKRELLTLLGGPKILLSLLAYPFIMLGILYAFSPYLWIDPLGHFMEIVDYYRNIGTGTPGELSTYLVGGWDIYPIVWILYTTPLPILVLSILGITYSVFLVFRKQSDTALLALLWFTVPIARVVWPGANIYGGVRQIMEFVPAMAILSGIGANYILSRLKNFQFSIFNFQSSYNSQIFKHLIIKNSIKILNSKLEIIFLVLYCVTLLILIIKLHPNQNVYFNQLVGGLSGAQERNIPGWGNSYGNVYFQGINWLNNNAEPNAKLALAVNYISAIPRLKLRPDIDLDNAHFSGTNRRGEYVMELSYDWPLKSRYKYAYYETFLEPVYRVMVDGVPLLKIWKNDLEHTKMGYEKEIVIKPLSVEVEQQKIRVDFAKEVFLTRLIIDHSKKDCQKQGEDGFIATSLDGKDFVRDPNPLFDPEFPYISPGMDEDTFVYQFAAKPAVSLIFNPRQPNSCIFKDYKVKVWGLAE